MNTEEIKELALEFLDDLKARDVVSLDVSQLTDVTDTLIIATGTSARHVKSLADNVAMEFKKRDYAPLGVEGGNVGDWVLVDLDSVVVHVMQEEARELYDLERLWAGPGPDGE
ncbi:Ribosomal silencing factor RsfS [Sinobacterium norvegicum]|uniref:Ribosomal silencing factor RsfS n=1 Tax=Sinobacterium norvegicum TaxID=1641715 RepID=A0ABN8EJ74_9GAMM|nr:ribosome silencing factor [Sinobacterium norvegicum]CAH0992431.1 Ribosomal silencing factor RsfS [Sinobacterium norvegicum]